MAEDELVLTACSSAADITTFISKYYGSTTKRKELG